MTIIFEQLRCWAVAGQQLGQARRRALSWGHLCLGSAGWWRKQYTSLARATDTSFPWEPGVGV